MSELKINITNVDHAGKDFSFDLGATWLAETLGECDVRPDPNAKPGHVSVHVQKNDNDYLVTGRVVADVLADCYRCLEDTPVHVDAHIASLFSATTRRPSDDDEDDELDYESFSGHELVLDNLVREHILLEVPMQPLCKADCAGIPIPEHVRPPADFGREDDIDPRLAPLKKLAQAKRNKE